MLIAGCLSGQVVNGVAGSASAPRSASEGARGRTEPEL
jgi:hypothetical protein